MIVIEFGVDFVTGREFPIEEVEAERVEDFALDDPFERTGTVCRVVAFAAEAPEKESAQCFMIH